MIFQAFLYFSKNIRKLLIQILIGTIILLIIISTLFYTLAKTEEHSNIQSFMEEHKEFLEEKISNELNDYLYNNLERYVRPSNYSLFFERPDNDLSFFLRMRISLIDSLRYANNISDLILYRVDDNAVVSAVNTSFSLDAQTSYIAKDLSTYYDKIKNIVNTHKEIKKPFFHITAENEVTYVYPVYQMNRWRDGDIYRGFAALFIKDSALFFHADVESFRKAGTFVVANEKSILQTERANTLSDEMIFEMLSSNPENNVISRKINSNAYTYYYERSPINDFYYLYYEPTPGFFQSLMSANYFSIYLLTIVITLLCYCIANIIISQKQYVEFNKKTIAENFRLKMEKSNRPSSELIKETLLTIQPKYSKYPIIIFDPNASYLDKMSKIQRDFFNESFLEQIKRTLSQFELPNIISLQPEGFIVCIINYDNTVDILDLVSKFPKELENFTKCSFNVFYTKPYSSKEVAVDTYPRLLQLMKYSFIYNYSNIFLLDQLDKIDRNTRVVDTMVLETVQGYLTELDPDKLSEYLNRILQSIRINGYSYNQTIDFLNMVFCSLKNFFIDKTLNYELKNKSLIEQLKDFKSLEECFNFIDSCFASYRENLISNSNTPNKRNMNAILKYIDDNIEDITLTAVAEEFHITSAHLSRIFKDNIGINFSEYVTEKKLLRAMELLKENANLCIADIANKLGYSTASYFSSKFKERFGITPGTYKKNILNNQ